MSRTNKLFFAVAKGKMVTGEASTFKRYVGIAACKIIAVNPSKDELNKIYGSNIDKEPVYFGEKDGVKFCRVDFIVRIDDKDAKDSEGNKIDAITRISFMLRNEYRYNKDQTKLQVIDKYGRVSWVTKEEFKTKSIPVDKNGNPLRIDSSYRATLTGEPQLTDFIRIYLGIPSVEKWEDKKIVGLIDNPEEAEARLDNIKNYFNGDFSEIKEIATYQIDNKVKALFGVRSTDDNKKYQSVFTELFLSAGSTNYAKIQKELDAAKSVGKYPNTEFFNQGETGVSPLKEYIETPTNFATEPSTSKEVEDDLPFGD